MKFRLVVIAVVVGHIAFAQSSDKPQTSAAQARLDAGTKAFKANDFATASKEFAAGFAAEPWSGFLFAWAQSERRRGDCASAVKLYTRFTATNPPAEVRQLADDGIAACGGVVEPHPNPSPSPSPSPNSSPSPTPSATPSPSSQGFQHKLAIGLAAGAVDLYHRAEDRRLVAQIAGGVSIGLAAAAVLRFVLHRPEQDDRFAITPSGVSFIARW